jgi:hypothetical protein
MTLAGRIIRRIASFYQSLKSETKRLVPVAINVIEGLKAVMDTPVDDVILEILKKAIPGTADDVLIDKIKGVVKEWLPKILLELKMVESVANIEDQNEQLKAILAQFKLSSDETKNIFYHGFASLILEKLSDGKLSWSDSIVIAEYFYKHELSNS